MRTLCLIVALFCAVPAWAIVPETARSRAAVARVSPALEADLAAKGLRLGAPVFLQITKQPATLEVFVRRDDGRYSAFRTYPICAFSGSLGPKLREGDGQAPEGFYTIRPRQMNPASSFHLSFDLGFPNAIDRAQGRTGSFLMVHGDCVSIGCYAMGDAAIEEIWTLMDRALRAGQTGVRVAAFPFPLTTENLDRRRNDPNIAFWRNLKEGADLFNATGRPPSWRVVRRAYSFAPD